MAKHLFDIRIQVDETNDGKFIARTIIGNQALLYEFKADNITDALCELICDMENCAAWDMIKNTPSLTHDFLRRWATITAPARAVPKAVPTSTPPKRNFATGGPVTSRHPTGPSNSNVKRVPWSDLIHVPKGQCESRCIVYDNFAAKKCGSFCPQK